MWRSRPGPRIIFSLHAGYQVKHAADRSNRPRCEDSLVVRVSRPMFCGHGSGAPCHFGCGLRPRCAFGSACDSATRVQSHQRVRRRLGHRREVQQETVAVRAQAERKRPPPKSLVNPDGSMENAPDRSPGFHRRWTRWSAVGLRVVKGNRPE